MRTLAITRTLLVAAAVAAPAGAARASGTAGATVGFWQNDQWSAGGDHDRAPRLDVALHLSLDGNVASRDVFRYDANVSWRSLQDSVNGAKTTDTKTLGYGLHVAALDNQTSPIRLGLSASRGQGTFASDPSRNIFGDTLTQTAGGSLGLAFEPMPPLSVGYLWTHSDQSIPGQPDTFVETHTVNAASSFGNAAFGVQGTYVGGVSDGSYVADRGTRHEVNVSADLGTGASALTLESTLFVTRPTELVPGTFEQQTSMFHGGYGGGGYAERHFGQYVYTHALIETPGEPARETARQSARYEGDHLLTDPSLFTRFTLDASLAQDRSGDLEARSTGETLGAQLWWRHVGPTTTYSVNAGPVVSLLQTESGSARGYGGSVGVQLSRPLGAHSFTFLWSGSYQDNAYASAGWSLTQSLSASLTGMLGRTRFNGTLSAYAFRTSQPILGAGAGRSVDAVFGVGIRRTSLRLQATLQQGMLGSTAQRFVGDGLLLPAPFDSRTVSVTGTASTTVWSGLTTSATVRYGSQDVPGRPVMEQFEAIGSLAYLYGGLTFSLEDRISRYQRAAGAWDTVNFFGIRAARAFGW